jgi:uncharacterized membrane protein YdjX (TVP38/TMEM64 family)
MLKSAGVRWAIVGTLIAILVLVPFMIWDEQITAWTEEFLVASADRPWIVGGVVVGLLAADIIAPIPNSLIATFSGMLLGFVRGTLASTIGMTISAVIGYYVGLKAGRPAIGKFVGDEELKRLERLIGRFGYWAIALTRALPVLGEASVIFAGMSRMPMVRFLPGRSVGDLCRHEQDAHGPLSCCLGALVAGPVGRVRCSRRLHARGGIFRLRIPCLRRDFRPGDAGCVADRKAD